MGGPLDSIFHYLQCPVIVSTITPALRTEIDLNVVDTSCTSANRFDSLESHNCSASGTTEIFFRILVHHTGIIHVRRDVSRRSWSGSSIKRQFVSRSGHTRRKLSHLPAK